MNHHLNRKNVCKPLLEDMDIIDVKMYYGFKLQTKKSQKLLQMKQNVIQPQRIVQVSIRTYLIQNQTTPHFYHKTPQITTKIPQIAHQNPPKSTKIPPKSTTLLPQNTTNLPQKTTLLPQNTTKINQCKYCNKILSRYDSLSRHMKTCKEKKEVELTMIQNEEMIKIKKESEDMKKEIEELKNFKIQTQNNITNNHNNSHNKTNNIIINNYGDEDLKHLRTRDFKKLLNGIYSAVPKLIEKIHFDPEHPENQNIKYPNMNKPFLKIMKDDNGNL